MFKVDGFETIKGQQRLFIFKGANLFMSRSYASTIPTAVRDTGSLPAVERWGFCPWEGRAAPLIPSSFRIIFLPSKCDFPVSHFL